MGKKIIFDGADFSENAIIMNFLMKIKAGESFTYNDVTYYGGENGKYYELNEVPSTFSSNTNVNYLQEVTIGKPETTLAAQYFMNQRSLEKVTFQNGVSLASVCYNLFKGCALLKEVIGIPDISSTTQINGLFSGCSSLEELDLSQWDFSNVVYAPQMFLSCTSLKTVDVSSISTTDATNLSSMFSGCQNIESITFGANFIWNKSGLDISSMFYNCNALTTIVAPNCSVSDTTASGSITKALLDTINGSTYNSVRENKTLNIICSDGTIVGKYTHKTKSWSFFV